MQNLHKCMRMIKNCSDCMQFMTAFRLRGSQRNAHANSLKRWAASQGPLWVRSSRLASGEKVEALQKDERALLEERSRGIDTTVRATISCGELRIRLGMSAVFIAGPDSRSANRIGHFTAPSASCRKGPFSVCPVTSLGHARSVGNRELPTRAS
jgi:hypothetical protein